MQASLLIDRDPFDRNPTIQAQLPQEQALKHVHALISSFQEAMSLYGLWPVCSEITDVLKIYLCP